MIPESPAQDLAPFSGVDLACLHQKSELVHKLPDGGVRGELQNLGKDSTYGRTVGTVRDEGFGRGEDQAGNEVFQD